MIKGSIGSQYKSDEVRKHDGNVAQMMQELDTVMTRGYSHLSSCRLRHLRLFNQKLKKKDGKQNEFITFATVT